MAKKNKQKIFLEFLKGKKSKEIERLLILGIEVTGQIEKFIKNQMLVNEQVIENMELFLKIQEANIKKIKFLSKTIFISSLFLSISIIILILRLSLKI